MHHLLPPLSLMQHLSLFTKRSADFNDAHTSSLMLTNSMHGDVYQTADPTRTQDLRADNNVVLLIGGAGGIGKLWLAMPKVTSWTSGIFILIVIWMSWRSTSPKLWRRILWSWGFWMLNCNQVVICGILDLSKILGAAFKRDLKLPAGRNIMKKWEHNTRIKWIPIIR